VEQVILKCPSEDRNATGHFTRWMDALLLRNEHVKALTDSQSADDNKGRASVHHIHS